MLHEFARIADIQNTTLPQIRHQMRRFPNLFNVLVTNEPAWGLSLHKPPDFGALGDTFLPETCLPLSKVGCICMSIIIQWRYVDDAYMRLSRLILRDCNLEYTKKFVSKVLQLLLLQCLFELYSWWISKFPITLCLSCRDKWHGANRWLVLLPSNILYFIYTNIIPISLAVLEF